MSVVRCPSCGRAWDGGLCFACGYEQGQALSRRSSTVTAPSVGSPSPPQSTGAAGGAGGPPIPPGPPVVIAPGIQFETPRVSTQNPFARAAPGVGASGAPSFAPLPPLPPIGRPPTAAGVPGVGAAILPAPSFSPQTPGFPPSVQQQQQFTPSFLPPTLQPGGFQAPQPSFPPQQQQQQPAPFQQPPSFQPPGFQPATFEPPPGRPVAPPTAPVALRPAVLNQPRPAPMPVRPEPPSSPASPASDVDDERTVDVDRAPMPKWRRMSRRLYASPAVFGVAFVLGFFFTFGLGGLIFLRGPSVEDLLAADQLDDVIAILQAREEAREMEPRDWAIYGHALNRRYGSLQRVRMLDKYAQAVREKAVDSTALENTINALADEKARDRAMVVLEDWPASDDHRLDPNRRLLAFVTDENRLLRHSAVEALKKRNAPAQLVFAAVAASALQDVKSQDCTNNIARQGLLDILELTEQKPEDARAAFGAANPVPHLIHLTSAELAKMRCVDEALVKKTLAAVSPFVK